MPLYYLSYIYYLDDTGLGHSSVMLTEHIPPRQPMIIARPGLFANSQVKLEEFIVKAKEGRKFYHKTYPISESEKLGFLHRVNGDRQLNPVEVTKWGQPSEDGVGGPRRKKYTNNCKDYALSLLRAAEIDDTSLSNLGPSMPLFSGKLSELRFEVKKQKPISRRVKTTVPSATDAARSQTIEIASRTELLGWDCPFIISERKNYKNFSSLEKEAHLSNIAKLELQLYTRNSSKENDILEISALIQDIDWRQIYQDYQNKRSSWGHNLTQNPATKAFLEALLDYCLSSKALDPKIILYSRIMKFLSSKTTSYMRSLLLSIFNTTTASIPEKLRPHLRSLKTRILSEEQMVHPDDRQRKQPHQDTRASRSISVSEPPNSLVLPEERNSLKEAISVPEDLQPFSSRTLRKRTLSEEQIDTFGDGKHQQTSNKRRRATVDNDVTESSLVLPVVVVDQKIQTPQPPQTTISETSTTNDRSLANSLHVIPDARAPSDPELRWKQGGAATLGVVSFGGGSASATTTGLDGIRVQMASLTLKNVHYLLIYTNLTFVYLN